MGTYPVSQAHVFRSALNHVHVQSAWKNHVWTWRKNNKLFIAPRITSFIPPNSSAGATSRGDVSWGCWPFFLKTKNQEVRRLKVLKSYLSRSFRFWAKTILSHLSASETTKTQLTTISSGLPKLQNSHRQTEYYLNRHRDLLVLPTAEARYFRPTNSRRRSRLTHFMTYCDTFLLPWANPEDMLAHKTWN